MPISNSRDQDWLTRPLAKLVRGRGSYDGSGTFRIPLLYSGLRLFVYLVRRGAARWAELMYVSTGIALIIATNLRENKLMWAATKLHEILTSC